MQTLFRFSDLYTFIQRIGKAKYEKSGTKIFFFFLEQEFSNANVFRHMG